jgi:two-component system, OmpR family, sensor histidine kinase MtrB
MHQVQIAYASPATQPYRLVRFLHDAIQPLSALKLQLQLAKRRSARGALSPAEIGTTIETSIIRVDRASLRLRRIMQAANSGRGLGLRLRRYRLDRIVAEVTGELPDPRRSRVRLVLDGPVVGLYDRDRVRAVIEGLLENAFKYSPADTPIVVRVRALRTWAEIAVADRGIGVSEAERKLLFAPAARSVRARTQPGSGLGLYLSRQTVRAHGGQITARSEGVGRGTTVRVRLPMLVAAPRRARSLRA